MSDRKGAALFERTDSWSGRKCPAQGGDTTLRIEVEDAGGPWRGGPPGDGRPHGLDDAPGIIIVRADSSYYSAAFRGAAHRDGVRFSVTVNTDPKIAAGIAAIGETAWTAIRYPLAVWDDQLRSWVSDAQIAEVPFRALASRKARRSPPGRGG